MSLIATGGFHGYPAIFGDLVVAPDERPPPAAGALLDGARNAEAAAPVPLPS